LVGNIEEEGAQQIALRGRAMEPSALSKGSSRMEQVFKPKKQGSNDAAFHAEEMTPITLHRDPLPCRNSNAKTVGAKKERTFMPAQAAGEDDEATAKIRVD